MTNATDTNADSLLDLAREQGRLSGEVRVLKWAVGAAFVALIAAFGGIYAEMNQGFVEVNRQFREVDQQFREVDQRFREVDQRFREVNQQFREVNQQFRDVNGRIDQLAYGVSDVRERLARVEGQIGDLRAAGTPQASESEQ